MALELAGIRSIFSQTKEDGQRMTFRGGNEYPEGSDDFNDVDWFDNFGGSTLSTTNWTETTNDSGTVSQAGGIVTLSTGTTDESLAEITGKTTKALETEGKIVLEAKIRLNATGTADFTSEMGLEGVGTKYIWFSHATVYTNTSDFTCSIFDGTSGVGLLKFSLMTDNTWLRLKIVATTSRVEYYVNDVIQYSVSSNIPTSAQLYPIFNIKSKEPNKNSTLEVDWVKFTTLNV